MCGIIGYLGKENAVPILVNGLRRLEYRGYDSAGLVVIGSRGQLESAKAVGRIDALVEKLKGHNIAGGVGIAHTRWATHGQVTEANAHPHFSCDGRIAVVHNGIIENYRELKEKFLARHKFVSETDSEVLAHLVDHFYKLPTENGGGNLRVALERSLGLVVGTYGVAVVSADEPQKIVCARRGSPLVLGVTDDGFFIASDASPLLPYTKKVVYLDDGEVLEILPDKFQIFNLKDKEVKKTVEEIEWSESQAQKGGFPHFMLKEIFEEPLTFQDAWRGRLLFNEGTAHLGGLNLTEEQLREIKNVVLVGCGTAYYACLAGKYIIEQLSDITVSAEIASEFRYRDPVLPPGTLMVAVSQSGETADTLAAMREARQKGATVMGVVNVVGSTIAREAGRGVYIHAGPELAVASTKAFINQLAVLSILGLELGRLHNLSLVKGQEIIGQIMELPDKMKKVLEQSEAIKKIAEKYQKYQNFYFIGRGFNFPVALEGALKLKEVSYIHAEGVAAGELKHGPIALIDENCPVVGIALQDALYDKMMNNLEEIKARRGKIILVATEGDTKAKEIAEDIIYVPPTIHFLEPLLAVIPLHLLAYHMAVLCGRDVDRPRNLAKSVTVE